MSWHRRDKFYRSISYVIIAFDWLTHLHEQSCSHAAPQVLVVLGAVEVSAEQGEGELAHDAGQLVPHAVCALQ